MRDKNLLEPLDIYADLIDKQSQVIEQLTEMTKKQATEIKHLQNIAGCVELNPTRPEEQ